MPQTKRKYLFEIITLIIVGELTRLSKAVNTNEIISNKESNSTHLTHIHTTIASAAVVAFNSHNNTDDKHLKFFETLREITGIYLFPVIGILGIIGNIFIVIVYSKSKKYSTNVYLIALSCSDILKLANDMTYFMVTLVSKFDPILGEKMFLVLYKYSHYLFVITSFNTSW